MSLEEIYPRFETIIIMTMHYKAVPVQGAIMTISDFNKTRVTDKALYSG